MTKCHWCKRADGSHTERCPRGAAGPKIGRGFARSMSRVRMESRANTLLAEAEREAADLRGQLAVRDARIQVLRELLGAG